VSDGTRAVRRTDGQTNRETPDRRICTLSATETASAIIFV